MARNILDNVFSTLAPDAPQLLRKITLQESSTNVFTRVATSDQFDALMTQIAHQYAIAENSAERINVLSLVANVMPIAQVHQYIEGE